MKKGWIPLACAGMACLLFWGCSPTESGEEVKPVLWFAGDTSEWTDTTTAVDTLAYSGEMSVPELMDALLSGAPPESGLLPTFPAGTVLQEWWMEQDGCLRLDLSEEYGELTGVDLILADYCITMTMEQLSQVDRVSITVDGERIGSRYRQHLSGDQVILSGAEEQPVEVSVELYFPRSGGRGLGLEERTFLVTEDDVLVEIVTQAILDGPASPGLTSVIPEGTRLLSVRLEDSVCYANFSSELVERIPAEEDAQILVLYSLADTLGNLEAVESLVLQVEGQNMERYGEIEFGGILEPDFGLVGNH